MSCKKRAIGFSKRGDVLHYVVAKPCVDMRESPRLDAQIVSQALFGEAVDVKKRSGDWALIETPDRYAGWILAASLVERESAYKGDAEITRLSAHVYSSAAVEYGPILTLPYGVRLAVIDAAHPRWVEIVLPEGKKGYVQKGDLVAEPFAWGPFCKKFLGLPYTWGGRSSFGFDCSGFVQMVYQKIGIALPRDSKDQFGRGEPIPFDQLEEGDLIFWGKSEREIRHVGLSLGGEEFIHTSTKENKPYLRLSKLSDEEWNGGPKADYPYRAAHHLAGKKPKTGAYESNFCS